MVALPQPVDEGTVATIYHVDDGSLGTCRLDPTGKRVLVIANDPARQDELAAYIRGRYRLWQRRTRKDGQPFSAAIFMQNITRWAGSIFYSLVYPPRLDRSWLHEMLPVRISAAKLRTTDLDLHETTVQPQ